MRSKRESELEEVKKELLKERDEHESQLHNMRVKYQTQVEDLEERMETQKKVRGKYFSSTCWIKKLSYFPFHHLFVDF